LTTVDISKFPRLRSLYADSNQIQALAHSTNHKPVRLEYLSLRDQDVYDLSLSYDHLRDVKRLYISGKIMQLQPEEFRLTGVRATGNHLSSQFFPTRPLYSLVYLEAAACSLSEWPENFALRLPNLRILNMNYNFLEDLSGLEGLQGLRKLMMIGCRLGEERSSSVMRSVRQIGTLEEIDLRYVFRRELVRW
jgi:Leucine-rich repeat (LRR) protein